MATHRGRPPKPGSDAWFKRQAEERAEALAREARWAERARVMAEEAAKRAAEPEPKSKYVVHRYGSINEFIDAATNKWTNIESNRQYAQTHYSHTDSGWFGLEYSAKFPDIAKLVKDGWTDGARRLFDTSEHVRKPALESINRHMIWKDEGEEISLDRLYSGEFDTMWRGFKPARKKQAGRIVRLACNISANSSVESSEMFWTGAATIVLADILTKAGFSVQIDLLNASYNGSMEDAIAAITTVKDADQPLSISGLASTLCLAGYYRSIGLVWNWKHYRTPAPSTCGRAGHDFSLDEPVVIEFRHGDVETQAQCVGWVEDKLQAFA